MFAPFQYFLNPHLQDINPIFVGEAECPPGLIQHPPKRDCTILHYIRRGRGTFYIRGKTYHVQEGQIFLILPGEKAVYTADKDDPWFYRWVGFTGASSHRFAELPPVVCVPNEIFSNLCDLKDPGCNLEYQLTSELFYLQARLLAPKKEKPDPVQWVLDYVQMSYMQELSVQKMADQLNIDRSYLFRKFKKRTGLSIKDYIQKVRTNKAQWYLEQGYSVKETAMLCGFGSASNFSKQFSRGESGMRPQQWQKHIMQTRSTERQKEP